ncbi:hypothetical protein KCP71_24605 [Salmonella enterica subsp. enterica]|nr:hypothetical protein KCP71_24605 [Salmonella enterica subsp. enterica]
MVAKRNSGSRWIPKVLAIIGMIGFGLWLLFSGHGGEHASIDNPLAL